MVPCDIHIPSLFYVKKDDAGETLSKFTSGSKLLLHWIDKESGIKSRVVHDYLESWFRGCMEGTAKATSRRSFQWHFE
jgi:hypothetical protein